MRKGSCTLFPSFIHAYKYIFTSHRGLAPGEQPVKAPVLSTEGPKCESVHVQLEPPPISSLSGVPSSSLVTSSEPSSREKTYNFDNVFGPEADQGMVYQTVVTPALSEVLAGYNCTVFAYGQTGTGKTHTMEGDLNSQLGTYSAEAGIIPRTLYRLFHQLELSEKEYSVHASFVELYNEELRDLLSVEQPKSLAAGGLRMYDDKNKGVVLQGLEDIPMSDASHGLELLRRGSHKRQIAATNCNESSSRSHSVFTLTVHTKETTQKGEDVVKVGKLNLVDLAGSENIGRSGAENKRAREAGMINQSLLTLGRVINALVEKSSHVPYRESKLTRLLQESLGGRTKTCIIATVSAEKSNQEETLSTLDYALRAKSIKNRPEMNSRMTRAGLINEYVKEIEKLKRDVLAARLQEGVYVSDESYKEMQEESDARKAAADELRRTVEVAESKRASLQEQFEQNMQLLLKRESEMKIIKTECSERRRDLDKAIDQAKELSVAVAEEKELREAYRNSERKLSKIASRLKAQADEDQSDLGGLFAKLERKTQVEQNNQGLVDEYRMAISGQMAQLAQTSAQFRELQENFANRLRSKLRAHQTDEQAALAQQTETINAGLNALRNLTASLGSELEVDQTRIQEVTAGIATLKEQVTSVLEDRRTTLSSDWTELQKQLLESNASHLTNSENAMRSLQEIIHGIVQQTHKHTQFEKRKIARIRLLSEAASHREVTSLREQNQLLTTLLEDERAKSTRMRERLAKSISDLVLGYTAERDESLIEAIGSVQSKMTASEANASAFVEDHGKQMDALEQKAQEHNASLAACEQAAKTQFTSGQVSLQTTQEKLSEAAQLWGENLSHSLEASGAEVSGALSDLHLEGRRIHEQAKTSHHAQRCRLQDIAKGVDSTVGPTISQLQSTLSNIQRVSSSCDELTAEQKNQSDDFVQHIEGSLTDMRESNRHYLSEAFAQDVPTGTTPIKKDQGERVGPWRLVPKERPLAIAQYRRQLEKRQKVLKSKAKAASLRKGSRMSVAVSEAEADVTLVSLPDDTRGSIVDEEDGVQRAQSVIASSDEGGESEYEMLRDDAEVRSHHDGEAHRLSEASDDESDDASFDDSIGGTLTENEETVRLGGAGTTTTRDAQAQAQRLPRQSVLVSGPTQGRLKRRAPTALLAPDLGGLSRKVASGRSVSSAAAPSTRSVLGEKTVDGNVATVEGRGASSKMPTSMAQRKQSMQAHAGGGGRRITKA